MSYSVLKSFTLTTYRLFRHALPSLTLYRQHSGTHCTCLCAVHSKLLVVAGCACYWLWLCLAGAFYFQKNKPAQPSNTPVQPDGRLGYVQRCLG